MLQPIRVLVAKPGLDGHDRGALVIAQGLRDQGMEVIYTGLRQMPEQIVATAIQEDVACIGLSSLSGAHMALFPEVRRLLKERGAEDILVIGGGVIPEEDVRALKQVGVAEIFTPGARIEDVAQFIRNHVQLANLVTASPADALFAQVDHIGIAVKSIAEALPLYTRTFALSASHEEVIADQGVRVVFIPVGEVELELLEPIDASSAVAKWIEKKGSGIHHIAYRVQDVRQALATAKDAGLRLIDETPRAGGQGKQIAFLHPKDTFGALIEFCQRMDGGDEA